MIYLLIVNMVTSPHLIQIRVGKRKRKCKIVIIIIPSVKVVCAYPTLYNTKESKYIILLCIARFIEQWEIETSLNVYLGRFIVQIFPINNIFPIEYFLSNCIFENLYRIISKVQNIIMIYYNL